MSRFTSASVLLIGLTPLAVAPVFVLCISTEAATAHPSGFSYSQPRVSARKRKFKLVDHSCESGCIETYESDDGQQVQATLACHTSTSAEARSEMRRWINEGRVVQRTWRYYGKGRQRTRAQRTIAIYPKDETDVKPVKIFWYLEGFCFNYIEAGSLRLVLDFERSDAFADAVTEH